ncbi:DUF2963 domain-containing protein, partial ['Elaeagnus angustifolia' witches'-broom phytoplasma]|nr:DUF2963 domain-containing protein ['Elaeagnus angustifolia' witches'-broom phytoplasma]MCX2955856.1 DUF2963 domain-containing protein [Candidatus Phytoplasma australiense]
FDSNGDLIKKILYEDDGKTIDCITDYDPKMGEPLKETYYDLDGNIKETKTF